MKERLSSFLGILTAVLASACCLGPALFIFFGITGLGFLSRLDWLRPYMLALTIISVVIAFHYAYGKGARCAEECSPRALKINRALFWVLVGFTLFGFGFPYVFAWVME